MASCLHLNFHTFLPTVLLLRLFPANADKSRNMFIVVAQRFSLCKPTTTTTLCTRVAYKTNIDFVAVVVAVVVAAAAAAAVVVAVVHADGAAAADGVAVVGSAAAADGAGQCCGASNRSSRPKLCSPRSLVSD